MIDPFAKELLKEIEIAVRGLKAIIKESNDTIAVKIAEQTLEQIN